MLGSEVRQIAAHKELLIVNDTAPPIKAAYPPIAVLKQKYASREFSMPKVLYLGDIDADFKYAENTQANFQSGSEYSNTGGNNTPNRTILDDETFENIIEEVVEEIFNENPIFSENEEINMETEAELLHEKEDIGSRMREAESEKAASQTENSTVILRKEIQNQSEPELDAESDALEGLSDDVRAEHRELKARAEMEVSRSIF